ncbi:MAG TPA: hypothetical protein VN794_18670 [Methylomirabilota bacterium]|nr:hypothetical protein [Methylomirabilota bacterium]
MNKFQRKIIVDALEDPAPLTDWEFDFVNDLAGKADEYTLTEKQNKIVNRIGEKYL